MIPLNQNSLLTHLSAIQCHLPLKLHIFDTIDSTNNFLKNLPISNTLDICCAETQTIGRGRFNRSWYSPWGENIYLSIRWPISCTIKKLSALSLVISLSVITALKQLGINDNILIKWPNDLMWQDKKLSGNLIEITHNHSHVIIGIGLNVNSNSNDNTHTVIDQPWCSLSDITGQHFDRNNIIAAIIATLHHTLPQFMTTGFMQFMQEWNNLDYLKDRMITISNNNAQPIVGTAMGVNDTGQLLIQDKLNITHVCISGETSVQTA